MADLPSKVRFCNSSGCMTRMSSVDKDRHLLCPKCTGWVCSLERRCDLCKEWSEEEMRAYCALMEMKERNKAYKAKQRAAKVTAGTAGDSTVRGPAHLLSSSDDSIDDLGKKVPFSVDRELDQPNIIRVDKPSIIPPSMSSVSLTQGLASLPGSSVAVGVDPLFTVDRELVPVSATGLRGESVSLADNHPQQGPSNDQVELGAGHFPQDIFRTPANLGHKVMPTSSGRSRGSFSASMNSALRAIVRENQESSEEEVMRKLKEYLNKTDPSLSSYSSERRKSSVAKSGTSSKKSIKVRDNSGEENAYYEPTEASFKVSQTHESQSELRKEIVEVEVYRSKSEAVKRSICDISSVPAGKKVKISRDLARMIETGGVKVRSDVRFFWVNKEGFSQFVMPASGRPKQGKVSALGEEEVPPTKSQGPSPAKAVSPAIVGTDPQSQETLGVSALCNVNDASVRQSALGARCDEREASLALGEGKASHFPRVGGVSRLGGSVLKSSIGSVLARIGSEGLADLMPDHEDVCSNFPLKSGGGEDSGSRILDLVYSEGQESSAIRNKDSVEVEVLARGRVIEDSVLKVVKPLKESAPWDSVFAASTPRMSFGALSVGHREVGVQSPFATSSVRSDAAGIPCHKSRYVFKGSESLPLVLDKFTADSKIDRASQVSVSRIDEEQLKIYAGSKRDRASQVTIARVNKEVQSKVEMVNAATYHVSRSLIPNPLPKASKGIQAFEEDPFRNILTDEEMINLMGVKQEMGLGLGSNPRESELVTCSVDFSTKIVSGVVYKVLLVKELYKEGSQENMGKSVEQTEVRIDKGVQGSITSEMEAASVKSSRPRDQSQEVSVDNGHEEVEELKVFNDKPWQALREKILEKQPEVELVNRPDMRTPYQLSREEPAAPKAQPFVLNSFICRSFENCDQLLNKKQGFSELPAPLPLGINSRIADQYRSSVVPSWGLDRDLGSLMEGMISGSLFFNSKRSTSISTNELVNLCSSAFRSLEILSFMMAVIDIVGDGFDLIASKVPESDKILVSEYGSFLSCLDKACRHSVRESLSILGNAMLKQRSVWASFFLKTVPKPIKVSLLGAPLSSFEVASKDSVLEAKSRFDGHVQSKALISAAFAGRALGQSRNWRGSFRPTSPNFRPMSSNFRRTASFRSYGVTRPGGRGGYPGRTGGVTNRWPRKRGLSKRKSEFYMKRDRYVGANRRLEAPPGSSKETQQ